MNTWAERPTEVANLLNPAFIGTLLRKAVEGYAEETESGLPFELAFLVIPLCLHPDTVSRLPARAASTPLHIWLQREENRDVLVSFGDRVSALVPFTREALVFAGQRGVIAFDDSGRLRPGDAPLRGITTYPNTSDDIKQAVRRAEFVGRWFALAGTTATIYSLLGVRP
jgi:Family of unknown function (DUF6521)